MKSLPARILLIVALLIALALAVAPKIIGLGIEQATINNVLELIPPEAESQLEIRRNEFSEGWFRSSATIEFIYTPIGTDAIALSMDFEIDHGPLLQTADGLRFGLASADVIPTIRNDLFDVAMADLEFPAPEVTLDILVRFDQSLRLGLHISPADYSGSDGEASFAGLEASVEVNPDQSAQFALEMGEISATEIAANSNIVVGGMTVASTTARINDILAASSATLKIPTISSTAPLPFSVSDISIDWGLQTSTTHPQSSDIYQILKAANIESEIPIRSISWNSEIKQLQNELLRDYYRLLSEIQNQYNLDPDAISVELTAFGQELLLLLIQNPLEANNLIELNSYGGDHSADLRIQWAGLSDLADVAALDMSAAISALNITLVISLELDAVLRSPLAGIVDPYVQQGYLTLNNGRVMVEASLQNSVLKVNGDELPLDQFF